MKKRADSVPSILAGRMLIREVASGQQAVGREAQRRGEARPAAES